MNKSCSNPVYKVRSAFGPRSGVVRDTPCSGTIRICTLRHDTRFGSSNIYRTIRYWTISCTTGILLRPHHNREHSWVISSRNDCFSCRITTEGLRTCIGRELTWIYGKRNAWLCLFVGLRRISNAVEQYEQVGARNLGHFVDYHVFVGHIFATVLSHRWTGKLGTKNPDYIASSSFQSCCSTEKEVIPQV